MPVGIIYKISSPDTDQVYIGSTTNKYLCSRKARHMYEFKGFLQGKKHYKSSFEILKYGNCVFDQLERFEYNHVSELRQRETEIMRKHPNKVNKFYSTRKTIEEQLEAFNKN